MTRMSVERTALGWAAGVLLHVGVALQPLLQPARRLVRADATT